MDYLKIYNKLINRAQGRVKHRKGTDGYIYFERHHIIPRCLGGSNQKENLVFLTAEEHWIAHLLLVKIHPGIPSLVYACQAMSMAGGNNQRTTNKLFGWIRREYSDKVSERNRGRILSTETKEKLSNALKGRPNHRQRGTGNVMHIPGVKEKALKAREGVKLGPRSDAVKKKISDSKKGHKGLDAEKNPAYKGEVIATPIEGGPEIRMRGRKEIEKNGFIYAQVRNCVNGKNKTHKGFSFRQENI